MDKTLLSFGHGYSAQALGRHLLGQGWRVIGTTRSAEKAARLAASGIEARVWPGSDLTDATVATARRNVERLGHADRVTILQGDLFEPLAISRRNSYSPKRAGSTSFPGSENCGVSVSPNQESTSPPAFSSASTALARQVWVLPEGSGTPVAVAVMPGISDGRMTEIVSGDLKVGMAVITDQKTAVAK